MRAVKALSYLEFRTFLNRIKNSSKHKLQILFLITLAVILVFAMSSTQTGQVVEYPDFIKDYTGTAISILILVSVVSAVLNAGTGLPIYVPPTSAHILFGLPLTSQQLCFYYFWKQFVIQASLSLFFTYFTVALMGSTYFPYGLLFTWTGLSLLSLWTNSLALLLYGFFKRCNITGKHLLILLLIFLAADNFVLSDDPGLWSFWETINPASWWPGSWFYTLIMFVFAPESAASKSAAPGVAIAGASILAITTIFLAWLVLPDCRHDLLRLIDRAGSVSRYETSLSPDEAWLRYFGARRSNYIAKKSFPSGTRSAIVWTELIAWERLKPSQLKYGLFTAILVGGASALLTTYRHVPAWVILILAPINSFGGGRPFLIVAHALYRQLPGSWWEKLSALIVLPIAENIGFHLMSLLAFSVSLVLINGIGGISLILPVLAPVVLLIVGLNALCMVWGLLSAMAGTRLMGAFRQIVKFVPVSINFATVTMAASMLHWQPAAVFALFVVVLLWSLFWLWIAALYMDRLGHFR